MKTKMVEQVDVDLWVKHVHKKHGRDMLAWPAHVRSALASMRVKRGAVEEQSSLLLAWGEANPRDCNTGVTLT